MSRPRLIALLLAFTTLLVFLPAGWHAFVNYDDPDYVTENSFVKNGLNATDIQWAFTTFHAANWHPLTWLSHQLDCTLFGLNAGAQHLINVLWHAANVALLFILLLRLTQKLWPSALIAALFAWHPLHVESVAWIAERKDVLSTFFALLSLLAYTRFVQNRKAERETPRAAGKKSSASLNLQPAAGDQRSAIYYTLALTFFALGLLAKPMLVTLPFVMLLLDFWPLKRIQESEFRMQNLKPLFIEKIPFFLFTAISCAVTFFAQKHDDAVASLRLVSLGYRLENAPVATAHYLLNLFCPVHLAVLYPMPKIIPLWQVILSVAVLIFISVAAWRWRKTKPYFLFGWLWFLGTLVPVIGLVQVGGQAMADRYTYLPSIGFFIAVVFLTRDFFAKIRVPEKFAVSFAAAILLASVGLTEWQLQFWRDSEALFRHAIAVTQNNDVALIDLGVALDVQHRFDEALVVYRQAEALDSTHFQLHNNLGNILGMLGQHTNSLAEYAQALALQPDNAVLHTAAGGELAALGQYDDALKEFAVAEKLDPHDPAPYIETAKILFKLGYDPQAVNTFRIALHLAPDNYQNLATVAHYLAANKNDAARDGQTAFKLAMKANDLSNHSQPLVFDALGMACAELGDFTNAQLCAESAVQIATSTQMKSLPEFQQRLELYRNHQPWRESFRDTNAVIKP